MYDLEIREEVIPNFIIGKQISIVYTIKRPRRVSSGQSFQNKSILLRKPQCNYVMRINQITSSFRSVYICDPPTD